MHLGDSCERRGWSSPALVALRVSGGIDVNRYARDRVAETLVRSGQELATGEFGHIDAASKPACRAHPHLVPLVGESPGQPVGMHPRQAGQCNHGLHAYGLLRRVRGCAQMTAVGDARRTELHHGRAGCRMAGISGDYMHVYP